MRKIIRDFLQLESASGVVLFAAALVAMLWANSSFYPIYAQFTNTWLFIINDGLMAVFFLLVGLELKRGFLEGQFARASDVLLPLAAAVGGMIVPALIYMSLNYADPVTLQGWATPVATDIAFAVGVLTLAGSRIPRSLKLFLLSIAIFDDIGAIVIIAVFYSHHLAYIYLFYATLVVLSLLMCNALRVRFLAVYLLGGAVLWALFLKAGIHPTIAGVITALLIPELPYKGVTPVHYLESLLHPWVAFGIMPLFALANAGLSFDQVHLSMLVDSVVLGIVLGLFVGKQMGVMAATWFSMKTTRWAVMPTGATWLEVYGIALLCGIGFTMSLFLGTLSFQGQNEYINEVRLGVMIGSLLSGMTGAAVLALAARRRKVDARR
jgi:NhaA family Na+:H+ antiporter